MTNYELHAIRSQARQAQEHFAWYEAERLWRSIGALDAARVCRGIIAANERGDLFRARVRLLQASGVNYWRALERAEREVYRAD